MRVSKAPQPSGVLEELEVTKRSVYRDIADLIGQRVPIRGEAGLG
jgi:predicted DNA-binding transcriptional regulator YafY